MAHCQWGEAQGDVAQNHCFIVLCTGAGPVAAPGPQCVTVVPRVVLGVGVLGSHALYVSHVPRAPVSFEARMTSVLVCWPVAPHPHGTAYAVV